MMNESTVRICWDDDAQTVIRMDFSNRWTWDDFYGALNTANAWIEACDGHVAIIAAPDGNFVYVPPQMLTKLKTLAALQHPRMDVAVIVGNNKLMEAVLNLARRVHAGLDALYHYAHSVEEARDIVRQKRASAH